MKELLIILSLIGLMTAPGYAASSHTITASGTHANTIAFFAGRKGVTQTQALQEICDTGLALALQQRTAIDAEEARRAFENASPEDQAAICLAYCNTGYVCPDFTCP